VSHSQAAKPELSVVVVSHHSAAVLPRCLDALTGQRGIALQVIVVDNGSQPPPDRHPRIDALRLNSDNPGFAVACNQGAALARADWLLFINPDCFPGPEDLATLLALARAQPNLGLLGAQLRNADGSPQAASLRRDPTPARLLAALRRGRMAVEVDAQTLPGARVWEAEAVSGALMLVPRTLFEKLGGFDENYRLHFEDLDLCRRVRAAGHRVLFAPAPAILHLKGSSSRRRPLWVAWQKHRGLRRYFERFDAACLGWSARQGMRLLLWLALPMLLLNALRDARSPSLPHEF
jgi:N-acetylglucosaminyl-diphospho-decaprenol L-rhamnosyltransferase